GIIDEGRGGEVRRAWGPAGGRRAVADASGGPASTAFACATHDEGARRHGGRAGAQMRVLRTRRRAGSVPAALNDSPMRGISMRSPASRRLLSPELSTSTPPAIT